MWTGLSGSGYAEEARCSANVKNCRVLQTFSPHEQQPLFKKKVLH
jgi:hypothetical protein